MSLGGGGRVQCLEKMGLYTLWVNIHIRTENNNVNKNTDSVPHRQDRLFFLFSPHSNTSGISCQFWLQFSRILFSAWSVWEAKMSSLLWYFSYINIQNSYHIRLELYIVIVVFFSLLHLSIPSMQNQFQWNKVSLIRIETKFFPLVCCNITDCLFLMQKQTNLTTT